MTRAESIARLRAALEDADPQDPVFHGPRFLEDLRAALEEIDALRPLAAGERVVVSGWGPGVITTVHPAEVWVAIDGGVAAGTRVPIEMDAAGAARIRRVR